MSYSINKVFVLGRLVKDPSLFETKSNLSIVNFTVATSEKFKNKEGEWEEKAEFHNITAFGNVADIVMKYAKKGDRVHVEGKLQTQKYEKDGETRYSTKILCSNIVLLSEKGGKAGEEVSKSKSQETDFIDDDIPF